MFLARKGRVDRGGHDGEAVNSRNKYNSASAADRAALLAFFNTL
jgi:CxxC motif-containing protein (DUF1111 family)